MCMVYSVYKNKLPHPFTKYNPRRPPISLSSIRCCLVRLYKKNCQSDNFHTQNNNNNNNIVSKVTFILKLKIFLKKKNLTICGLLINKTKQKKKLNEIMDQSSYKIKMKKNKKKIYDIKWN